MNSSKVVSKNHQITQLGRMAAVAFLVLAMCVGSLRAEDDARTVEVFKLWHDNSEGGALKHLTTESEKNEAKKWMVGDILAVDLKTDAGKEKAKESTAKFIEKFQKEPIQFVEALKLVKEEATKEFSKNKKEEKEKFEELKKAWKANLFDGEDAESKFDGDKQRLEAFKKLFAMIMEEGDKLGSDFLKKLFSSNWIKRALEITDKKPQPSVTNTPVPAVTSTPTVTPPAVTPPVQRSSETGEQYNDADLQKTAQQTCDKINAVNAKNDSDMKALKDQIDAKNEELKNAQNEILNKLAGLSQQPNNLGEVAKRKNNEKGLEEILAPLLANALNDRQQQEVTPPQNQTPFVPTTPARNRENDASSLNNALPEPVPSASPAAGMPFMPYQSAYAPVGQISLDLPSVSGRQELRDAQDALTNLQMRQSVASSLTVGASLPTLVAAKAKLRSDMQRGQGALTAAEERAARLDEQLEELKEGGRAALPSEVKRKQAQLEQDLNSKKARLQQQQQMMQMLPAEQRQSQEAMNGMAAVQQEVAQAEAQLAQYKAEVDIKVEEGNSKIKSLAKVRDNLQSVVSKLKGELGSVKEEESSLQELINTNVAMATQAQQQQPVGTQNINALRGVGGNGGVTRTSAPRLGAGLQSGSAVGSDVRGSLGSQK